MKLHWGHKIAIVYGLFVTFFVTLLIISLKMNHELVTDDYYEKEMATQSFIDASINLQNSPYRVGVDAKGGEISIHISGLEDADTPHGTVTLYKPDNAAFDEEFPLNLSAGKMMYNPRAKVGRIKVGVWFTLHGRNYYTESEILM